MKILSRRANWAAYLTVVCLAAVLLSTTVQNAHFCGFRLSGAQTRAELELTGPGSPACLICLMAPSISALLLLVAFFVMARSTAFASGLHMRPGPVLDICRLHTRPPPLA